MRLTHKKPTWRDKPCKHCNDTGLNPERKERKAKHQETTVTYLEPYRPEHNLCCPVCTT